MGGIAFGKDSISSGMSAGRGNRDLVAVDWKTIGKSENRKNGSQRLEPREEGRMRLVPTVWMVSEVGPPPWPESAWTAHPTFPDREAILANSRRQSCWSRVTC